MPVAVETDLGPADGDLARIAEVLDGKNIEHAWKHERVRTRAYRGARRLRRRVASSRATAMRRL
jgi:hypothetical protein